MKVGDYVRLHTAESGRYEPPKDYPYDKPHDWELPIGWVMRVKKKANGLVEVYGSNHHWTSKWKTIAIPESSIEVIPAYEGLIAFFKQEFIHHKEAFDRQCAEWDAKIAKDKTLYWYKPDKPRWNWDEEWDGVLVERVRKLGEAGFNITSFDRSQKIRFKLGNVPRDEAVAKLTEAVGSDWWGVKFMPSASVWWNKRPRYY